MGGVRPDPKSDDVVHRAPFVKPPFTLGELKKAIPPHCFQRSVLRSFSYLVHDLIIASLLYYVATSYFHLLPRPLPYLAWPLYWICQGLVVFGVWVVVHECGHHAFSDYQWVDDTIGLVLHSALLVPYFSWKISHRRHHSNTASLEFDEVYVPTKKSEVIWFAKYVNNPPGRAILLIILLTLAWPLYMMCNAFGRKYPRFACHFDPFSPIFSDRERALILVSDAGIFAATYGLYCLVAAKGLSWVLCIYGVPLVVINACLILLTYLHHTHPGLPHYDSSEWDWLRGALSTVDRDYGILNRVFHNVTDTHVVHHLFPTIPHYHAKEATKAIKPILGDYYRFDCTPIFKAVMRELKECIYVEADEGDKETNGVFWFKNKL